MDFLDFGGSVVAGLMGAGSAADTNAAQSEAAREQMAFQERLSNTAHQREVADLRAAGLNPMLSYFRSGASTPSGAMPVFQAPADLGMRAAASAWGNRKIAAEVGRIDLESMTEALRPALLRAQTLTEAERPAQVRELTHQIGYENARILSQTALNAGQLSFIGASTERMLELVKLTKEETARVHEAIALTIAERKLVTAREIGQGVRNRLLTLDIPEAQAMAEYWSSAWGKASPYGRDVVGAVSGLSRGTPPIRGGSPPRDMPGIGSRLPGRLDPESFVR